MSCTLFINLTFRSLIVISLSSAFLSLHKSNMNHNYKKTGIFIGKKSRPKEDLYFRSLGAFKSGVAQGDEPTWIKRVHKNKIWFWKKKINTAAYHNKHFKRKINNQVTTSWLVRNIKQSFQSAKTFWQFGAQNVLQIKNPRKGPTIAQHENIRREIKYNELQNRYFFCPSMFSTKNQGSWKWDNQ